MIAVTVDVDRFGPEREPFPGYVSRASDKLAVGEAVDGSGWKIYHRKTGRTVGGDTLQAAEAVARHRKLEPLAKWDTIFRVLHK
jgi:hypothetical protein